MAAGYDRWDARNRSIDRLRSDLVSPLHGSILEIAVGTGLNLPHYDPGCDVIACDISREMLKKAARRVASSRLSGIKLATIDAEHLPFLDNTFDNAVGTFVFCSIDDPDKAVREIRRVLRPGGRFVSIGYHTDYVLKLLRRAGMEVQSVREARGGDRPIGLIAAQKAGPLRRRKRTSTRSIP